MLLKEDCFLLGLAVLAIGWGTAFARRARLFPVAFWSAVGLYAILVLSITLFPIPFQEAGGLTPVPHNLIPLRGIRSAFEHGITLTALEQVGGNILLPLPYGILVGLLVREKRRLILPILFPLGIEAAQFLVGQAIGCAYRSFDVDDILLNGFGAYLGLLFGAVFLIKYRNRIQEKLFSRRGR